MGKPVLMARVKRWKFVEYRDERSDYQAVGTCAKDLGHFSEAEARRCYQDYRLAFVVKYVRHDDHLVERYFPRQKCGFEPCDELTNGYAAEFGYHVIDLCNEHLNAGSLRMILGEKASDYRYLSWTGGMRLKERPA